MSAKPLSTSPTTATQPRSPDDGSQRDAASPQPPNAHGGPKVLEKALTILEAFTERRPEWTVTELCRELEIPFPTVHRIVAALTAHRLLERHESKAYRLGSGALDLGLRARASLDIRARLEPALKFLWRATDETSSISVLDGRTLGARCIDQIEGGYPFRLVPAIGAIGPLHAGAMGKALLAHLGDDLIEHVLRRKLKRDTAKPTGSEKELRAELEKVRSQGYAFDDQELLVGVWGVAAPVFDSVGAVVASIGFIAPTIRLSDELTRRGIGYVQRSATIASSSLASEADEMPGS